VATPCAARMPIVRMSGMFGVNLLYTSPDLCSRSVLSVTTGQGLASSSLLAPLRGKSRIFCLSLSTVK